MTSDAEDGDAAASASAADSSVPSVCLQIRLLLFASEFSLLFLLLSLSDQEDAYEWSKEEDGTEERRVQFFHRAKISADKLDDSK